MQGSETLNNAIFQGGAPTKYALEGKINAMLTQYAPEVSKNPKAQEILSRIETLSQAVASRGEGTRVDLVNLYMETITKKHMLEYEEKVAILEDHQRNRIASILSASNDESFTQAA